MVNKCAAHGCKTGYDSEKQKQEENSHTGELDEDASEQTDSEETGDETIATFHFKKKYPELRAKWIRWMIRKDFTENHVVHEKHQSV